ncbi:MAG TPA: thiolase family protein [Alphaproteobacteria bacterium]|nr:thiolase family protein [Alphaproteobacteria bacterium]
MSGGAYIVAARRSPVGRMGGALRDLPVEALAAPVLRAVVEDAGLDPAGIDEVMLGNAAGPGGNVARLSLLQAGLPLDVPGVTIDRQCGSGLEAVNLAAALIASGAADCVLAGGVESTSTAPWRAERPARPGGLPRFYGRARFAPDAIGDPEMGVAAENVARACGIDRARQDAYALASHAKAVAAQDAGRFDREIVPLPTGGGLVHRDECPRRDTSLEKLARLPAAFVPGGTVTAGNSCPLNDGAAIVAVVSARRWAALGRPPALRVRATAAAGVDPNLLGLGPVPAVERLLRRSGVERGAINLVEFNEAFAAQVLASLDRLGLPESRVNRGGGALALGHPFGASGAILTVRLFSEMLDPKANAALGLATLGIGGGLGVATLVERVA